MSRYECIKAFTDLQDRYHVYNPGDKFPWDDKRVSMDRLIELSTNRNRLRTPLIKEIEDKPEPAPKAEPKIEAEVEAKVEAAAAEEPKKTSKPRGRKKKTPVEE